MKHQWSPWFRFDDEVAKQNVPDKPGVYEIRAPFEFGRLNGKSDIISIGSAKTSLKTRLYKELFSNSAKDKNRAVKWLDNAKQTLEFHYVVTASEDDALWLEAFRLWEYENEHWELPPGNDKLEKAIIIKRIEQKIGKVNDKTLRNLFAQYQTFDEIAIYLDIPRDDTRVIIENLKVYWGL